MTQPEAQSLAEKWWRKSQKYSINSDDALVTLFTKGFETIFVGLSKTPDYACMVPCLSSLDYERKLALQFESNELDIIRHLSFGLIECLQVLLEVKGKSIEEQNLTLVAEALNPSLTMVEPKNEPIDPIDQILERNQLPIVDDFMGESLFKEEEIDFNFEFDNVTLPMEQPSNDNDSQASIVNSAVMGDDMKFMDDQIMDYGNSTRIEKVSLYHSSNGENIDDSAQTEMMEEANELMDEEVEKDGRVRHTDDILKEDETGEMEMRRNPSRTSFRHVKYTESLDDSEPQVKKPRMESEKKIDNKRKSDINEYPPKHRSPRVPRINDTELECPNKCGYRWQSVSAWVRHLKNIHSTTPRQLGLVLLCECGNESFSSDHSLKCDISKIRVIRRSECKSATPKCVMCEMCPRTASGYAQHLNIHHKTNLPKMGLFLICSCGLEVRSLKFDPEHAKKCNGRNYTLHKVDDE